MFRNKQVVSREASTLNPARFIGAALISVLLFAGMLVSSPASAAAKSCTAKGKAAYEKSLKKSEQNYRAAKRKCNKLPGKTAKKTCLAIPAASYGKRKSRAAKARRRVIRKCRRKARGSRKCAVKAKKWKAKKMRSIRRRYARARRACRKSKIRLNSRKLCFLKADNKKKERTLKAKEQFRKKMRRCRRKRR